MKFSFRRKRQEQQWAVVLFCPRCGGVLAWEKEEDKAIHDGPINAERYWCSHDNEFFWIRSEKSS